MSGDGRASEEVDLNDITMTSVTTTGSQSVSEDLAYTEGTKMAPRSGYWTRDFNRNSYFL